MTSALSHAAFYFATVMYFPTHQNAHIRSTMTGEIGSIEKVVTSTESVQVVDDDGLAAKNLDKGISLTSTKELSSDASTDESQSTSLEDSEYPIEFFCPLTNQLLSDPVVAKSGETYEKCAYLRFIKQQGGDPEPAYDCYPNRALKAIIDDAIVYKGSSFQASLRRLQHVANRAFHEFLDPRPPSDNADDNPAVPLSDGFYCPITFNICHDPVIDPDGSTFEKAAIMNWIRLHGSSPVTRNSLSIEQLYPNHVIKRLLDAEKQKPEDKMHPDILRWKEEPAPSQSDLEYGGGVVAATTTDENGSSRPLHSSYHISLRRQRRRQAMRQLIFNLGSLLICVLLLRLVVVWHNSR